MAEATPNPAPAPAPEPTPVPAPAPAPEAAPVVKAERPAEVPEAFWDAEAGKLKTVDFAKAYAEAAKVKADHDTKMGLRPADPAGYKLEVPADVQMPEGVTFKFDEKSPLVAAAREFAHQNGLGQTEFNKLVGAYVQESLQRAHEAGAALAAERTKLGEKAAERVAAVENGLKSFLTVEQYAGIRGAVTNAAAVEAMEAILAKINSTGIASHVGGDGGKQKTEADLLAEMYPTMRKKG